MTNHTDVLKRGRKIQLGGNRFKNKPIRGYTTVDAEDYEWLSQYKWHMTWNGYAARTTADHKFVRMHREIMKTPKGMDTDHINEDKLDNRRANLRICTHAENVRNQGKLSTNKTGYKGTYWDSQTRKFVARIRSNNKLYRLGSFDNAKDAGMAYKNAVSKYHGNFAHS